MTTSRIPRPPALLITGLLLWFSVVVLASASGWLGSRSPFIPPPFAGFTVLVSSLLCWFVPSFRAYLRELGLRRLTAIHILRIAAVPLFFWYGNHGLLPQAFVKTAGWGDLAAGLLALGAVLWHRPAGYWIAHIFGTFDFLSAFSAAMRLTRTQPNSMHAITGLPIVLIPFFFVGFLATIHVICFRLLLKHSADEPGYASRLALKQAR